MPLGAQLRQPVGVGSAVRRPCTLLRSPHHVARRPLLVRAAAEGPAPAPEEGPREMSLVRKVPGAGYTFMLAGALKIMTIGWVATGAPRECVRTVAGQYAQFLLLPVGLLLCWIAKNIVDSGLHESRRFMTFVLGITAILYFGLYNVLYRYEPKTWASQQRIQAAAAHTRASPHAPGNDAAAHRQNKFIIQRQLEGEYDTYNSAYYSRAPEMQMDAVEERVGALPAGMVGGAAGGVGPSLAERQTGAVGRAGARRRAVPSMYETTSRLPGLEQEDTEF